MPTRGRQNTTFGTSSLLRSLGVQSQENPQIDPSQMIETVLVADLSKSFANQQFEARGVASADISSVAQRVFWEIKSNAPGGIVIESVNVFLTDNVSAPLTETFLMSRGVPALELVQVPVTRIINVGGADVASLLFVGSMGAALPDSVQVQTVDGVFRNDTFNWFVPSGDFFIVATEVVDRNLFTLVQWREIPQAPGPS